MSKAVFLDRDGTLNHDPGYLNNPDELKLISGAREAVQLLLDHGFKVYIVTNQSGIGRGLLDQEILARIHDRLIELLGGGEKISEILICPHHPDEKCQCRKPSPYLVLEASSRDGISLSESYFVGDNITDLQAGQSAGCKAVCLVRTGHGADTELKVKVGVDVDFVGNDLLDVVNWIVKEQ